MSVEIEIYTYCSNPFKMGRTMDVIKTVVSTYTEHDMPKGVKCIAVYNPIRERFHICEITSGAVVGSSENLEEALEEIRQDLVNAPASVIKKQLRDAKVVRSNGRTLTNDDWFSKFKI